VAKKKTKKKAGSSNARSALERAERRARTLRAAIEAQHPESDLTPLTKAELRALRKEHPGLPDELAALWSIVGCGFVQPSCYALHCLLDPTFLWGKRAVARDLPHLQGVWIVGDDFAGGHEAYDSKDGWAFVHIEGGGMMTRQPDESFLDFLERWFLAKS
jgi:hypothetical protein